MNRALPGVQDEFRKGRGTRDKIAKIHWIMVKAREFQKTSTSASLTTLKPLTVWITTYCGKFLKKWEYQNTLPVSCKTHMRFKNQQLELDVMYSFPNLGKEYIKAVYLHPAYFTYM